MASDDRVLQVVLKAVDQTQAAFKSVQGGLSGIAKTAAGTVLGLAGFQGIEAIFNGVIGSTIGMNQSLDATHRSAVAMLDSIRNSSGSVGASFAGSATQIQNWDRQFREITEREQAGLQDYADNTRRLNNDLQTLLSGDNIKRRLRDEQEALADLKRAHDETMAGIQAQLDTSNDDYERKTKNLNEQLAEAQNRRVVKNGDVIQMVDTQRVKSIQKELDDAKYAHDRRVSQLETRMSKEDADYQYQQAKRRRELDESLADLRAANEKRIAEVRDSLGKETIDQQRFIRDIKEAYGDLGRAKQLALSAGGGGSLGAGSGAVITYREELKKLGQTGEQIFGQFEQFFQEEGIRSPFSVEAIQRAGAQLSQFSGGSKANMENIVRMAESLAASPAVSDYSAAQRMDLAIRALSEAYNGQFTSLQRIFNIAGPTFDGLKTGTFTTTQFADGLNTALQQTGVNYSLVDAYSKTLDGSWNNLIETGKMLLANITHPAYQWLTDRLIGINTWVNNNRGAINAWADDMKTKVADFIQNQVQPKLDDFLRWLQSPDAKKQMDAWTRDLQNIGNAAKFVAESLNGIKKGWDTINDLGKNMNAQNPGSALGAATRNAISSFLQPFTSSWNAGWSGGITKRATGGIVGAGELTWVGERGPELVSLPAGSRVHPNGTGPTGGVTINLNGITIQKEADADMLVNKLAYMMQTRGSL